MPAGQLEHALTPVFGLYLPAGHWRHVVYPEPECCPAAQLVLCFEERARDKGREGA